MTLAADGYALAAAQFQTTASETMDASELVKSSVVKNSYDGENYNTGWENSAAKIMIRVGDGYQTYYYCGDADDGKGNYVEGWADKYGTLVSKPIATGKGFWLNGADVTTTFTLAGQVIGTATANAVGAAGYNLVANPYPQGFKINAEGITWGFTPQLSYPDGVNYNTGWETSATAIMIRVGEGYQTYYYCGDADDGKGNYVEGWSDKYGTLVDKTIDAGCGFWIESKDNSFTAVFTK